MQKLTLNFKFVLFETHNFIDIGGIKMLFYVYFKGSLVKADFEKALGRMTIGNKKTDYIFVNSKSIKGEFLVQKKKMVYI